MREGVREADKVLLWVTASVLRGLPMPLHVPLVVQLADALREMVASRVCVEVDDTKRLTVLLAEAVSTWVWVPVTELVPECMVPLLLLDVRLLVGRQLHDGLTDPVTVVADTVAVSEAL